MPNQRRIGVSEDNDPGVVVDGGDGPIELITPVGINVNGVGLAASVQAQLSGAYASSGTRMRPTGVLAETMIRTSITSSQSLLATGRQSFALIWLDAGTVVTNIAWLSGSTAVSVPTNQWFSLYDVSRNKLAVTVDDTTTAWAANTLKTLALSTPYTVLTSGLYYLGLMVKATTVPNVIGFAQSSNALTVLPPMLCGADTVNTGLTTPATAPATAAALADIAITPYAHVS